MTQANKPKLDTKKKRTIEKIPVATIAGVLFLLTLLAAFGSSPSYYIEMPGTAEDIRSVMTSGWKMDAKSDLMTL